MTDNQLLHKYIHHHVPPISQKNGQLIIMKFLWNKLKSTLTFGISRRPFSLFVPGGSGLPDGWTHRTLARLSPSSRHWNTTSSATWEHKKKMCQWNLFVFVVIKRAIIGFSFKILFEINPQHALELNCIFVMVETRFLGDSCIFGLLYNWKGDFLKKKATEYQSREK